MRKLLLATVGAAALAIGGVANAATVVGTSAGLGTTTSVTGDVTTINYFSTAPLSAVFDGWVDVGNLLDGLYSITLGTSTISVDFTSATFAGTPLSLDFDDGTREQYGLSNLYLASSGGGSYRLSAAGTNSDTNGSLAGTITIARAVPEPATWALMLLGFAGVGFAMRRSKKAHAALPQLA